MNLEEHLKRQIAFSRATFGPGPRTEGVIDHIREELQEVVEASDKAQELSSDNWEDPIVSKKAEEWVDVVILALDGLTRQLYHEMIKDPSLWGQKVTDMAANEAAALIERKQNINEFRKWPDWRTQDVDKKIKSIK